MSKIHLAHFPGKSIHHLMESLCGAPGMCCSNLAYVDCPNCRVAIDWAQDHGMLDNPAPNFYVVKGDPPRTLDKDQRDDYEFWFYDAPCCKVEVVVTRQCNYEWCDGWVPGRHTHTCTEYQLRAATEIPRPYIGADATDHKQWCRMTCARGSEGGACPCRSPNQCITPHSERASASMRIPE